MGMQAWTISNLPYQYKVHCAQTTMHVLVDIDASIVICSDVIPQ